MCPSIARCLFHKSFWGLVTFLADIFSGPFLGIVSGPFNSEPGNRRTPPHSRRCRWDLRANRTRPSGRLWRSTGDNVFWQQIVVQNFIFSLPEALSEVQVVVGELMPSAMACSRAEACRSCSGQHRLKRPCETNQMMLLGFLSMPLASVLVSEARTRAGPYHLQSL